MRPHHVHDSVSAELGKVVNANYSVIVVAPEVVYSRFELNQVVDAAWTPTGPFHLAHDSAEGVRVPDRGARKILEDPQHPICVKAPAIKIDFNVGSDVQLAGQQRFIHVYPGRSQMPEMTRLTVLTEDVNRFLTAIKPVLNERHQDAILFGLAVEEGANVARLEQLGARERHGLSLSHLISQSETRAGQLPTVRRRAHDAHSTLVSARVSSADCDSDGRRSPILTGSAGLLPLRESVEASQATQRRFK
jgi:hypothetical protein